MAFTSFFDENHGTDRIFIYVPRADTLSDTRNFIWIINVSLL